MAVLGGRALSGFRESAGWRAAVAMAALVVVAAAAFGLWRVAYAPSGAEAIAAEAARARAQAAPPPNPAVASKVKLLLVYVSGAVVNPGVYQLPRGARVADAIDAAGGLMADADVARLPNLAAKLTDGKQVKVPRRGSSAASASKVDINSASVEELMLVPGVDRPLAEAIVDEREGYGPFNTLTELHTILGLDTQVLAALRPYLKVVAPGS